MLRVGCLWIDDDRDTMFGSEGFLADGEGAAEERFGTLVATLGLLKPGQVVEAYGYARMPGSEGFLGDGKGAVEKWLGILVAALF